MITPFDPNADLILVAVELEGPLSTGVLRLALDTGATGTLIDVTLLATAGYDPATATDHVRITTGSGVESAPRFPVSKLRALGQEVVNFPVVAHTLPPSSGIDGVLGLDFLRARVLTVDFVNGQITLA